MVATCCWAGWGLHSCPHCARPTALPASTTDCFNSCYGFLGSQGTAAWGLEWLQGWWEQEAACLGGWSDWGTQGLTLCLHVAGWELWLARSSPWGFVPLMCSKPGFIHGALSSASARPKYCLVAARHLRAGPSRRCSMAVRLPRCTFGCYFKNSYIKVYLLKYLIHVILCKCRNLNWANEVIPSPFAFHIWL